LIQIILGILKAFPGIAKVLGKAVDFYRESEARKVYEAKLTDIDSAINRFDQRMQNQNRRHQKTDGETRLPDGSEGSPELGKGSPSGDSSTGV
tara:strand:+ start:297 stop:575 length:279 start_codon:yes stop_codon:yes gene_type:complete